MYSHRQKVSCTTCSSILPRGNATVGSNKKIPMSESESEHGCKGKEVAEKSPKWSRSKIEGKVDVRKKVKVKVKVERVGLKVIKGRRARHVSCQNRSKM